jgi:hypothetical protein
MLYDQSQKVTAGFVLPPAEYDADNSPASFDCGTSLSATICLQVGVGGITFTADNKVEFILTHSDVTGEGFTAVTQADVVGVTVAEGGIVRALVAAHAAPSVTLIGYRGRKRFLRLLADFSGTHADPTPMSAAVIRGNLDRVNPPA